MASLTLTLWLCLHKEDAHSSIDEIPCRAGGVKNLLGFRTDPESAVTRAQETWNRPVTKDEFVLARVEFSPLGVAHYTLTTTGIEHSFAPMLWKRTYSDKHDWGVWYFHGALPMKKDDLLTVSVHEII